MFLPCRNDEKYMSSLGNALGKWICSKFDVWDRDSILYSLHHILNSVNKNIFRFNVAWIIYRYIPNIVLFVFVVNFCHVVPDGMLVFFPSYVTMETCTKHWQVVMMNWEEYSSLFDRVFLQCIFCCWQNVFCLNRPQVSGTGLNTAKQCLLNQEERSSLPRSV